MMYWFESSTVDDMREFAIRMELGREPLDREEIARKIGDWADDLDYDGVCDGCKEAWETIDALEMDLCDAVDDFKVWERWREGKSMRKGVMTMATDRPEEVVDAIIADLNGRKHLGIDTCDQDIQEEIRETWIQIVESWLAVISKKGGTPIASTCVSSQLTIDQLEELAGLKVDNEALRKKVLRKNQRLEELRTDNDLLRDEMKQLHIDLDKANKRVEELQEKIRC